MEDYNSEMDQNFDDEKVLSHNDSDSRFESEKSSSNAMGSLILNESSNNEGFKLSSGTTETKENESKKTLNNEEKKFYHVENLSLKEPIKNYVFTEAKKSINHTFDPEVRVHGDETEIKYRNISKFKKIAEKGRIFVMLLKIKLIIKIPKGY